MTDRITLADLAGAVQSYVGALGALGVTYDGTIHLQEGSKTNGIAWRLMISDSGLRWPPVGSDYLGMTKAEAYQTLTTTNRALWDLYSIRERT
jgi:hypothetical protein